MKQLACSKLLVAVFGMALSLAAGRIVDAASITYIGVIYDRNDFDRLNIGNAGYWFPQFGATSPVATRPTGENARDALPAWAGPLNHVTNPLDPSYSTRTFSQDGPARSKGCRVAKPGCPARSSILTLAAIPTTRSTGSSSTRECSVRFIFMS
jgi:hypothetical protein